MPTLVAMASVFGAASRSTFAFIIFAFEITQDYNAILPLMLVSVITDGVAYYLMRNTIMTEKPAQRGLRVNQEYEADIYRQVTVGEVMLEEVPTLPANMTARALAKRFAVPDPVLARYQALPLVDGEDQLVGIVTRGDVVRALQDADGAELPLRVIGNEQPIVAHPDEPLDDAIARMLHHDVGRLPVVGRDDPRRLVGYLSRSGVISARSKRLEEESMTEPGWMAAFRRRR